MSRAYYNEHDPFAAAWLRELIAAGEIAAGDVDERSITNVSPDDLTGYTQCHFFAGIGGWSLALRRAGWPDDRPVWTGSCPCQPFSSAGRGRGKDDARHLWPQFRRLIRQRRPPVVFGEQVASKLGRTWLSAVFADLEALAYRAAGADLCGPSVGAFDIRQRLWFVADTDGRESGYQRVQRRREYRLRAEGRCTDGDARDAERSEAGGMADAEHAERRSIGVARRDGCDGPDGGWSEAHSQPGACREVRGLGDRLGTGLQGHAGDGDDGDQPGRIGARAARSVAAASGAGWHCAEWLACRDGKWRPIPAAEPVSKLISDGLSGIMGADWNRYLEAVEEAVMNHAASCLTRPDEVLRAVWNRLAAAQIRRCVGGPAAVSQETVLFLAVCELAWRMGGVIDSAASRLSTIPEISVRILRGQAVEPEAFTCPSRQRRLVPEALPAVEEVRRPLGDGEAPAWDAARLIVGARIAIAALGFPLAESIPNRTGVLRGAGNAIKPQVAAAFIAAYLDAVEGFEP